MNEAHRQLEAAGCLPFLRDVLVSQFTVAAIAQLALVAKLRADTRFMSGIFFGLHRDVGDDLMDFRSFRGALGKGSLQIVLDKKTGRLYADVDRYSAYQDVVNVIGHLFGEVVPHWARRYWPFGKRTGSHV